MKAKRWNIMGLVVAGALVGAAGVVTSQKAIGLEGEKAAPPPVSPAVTAPLRAFSQAFETVASQVKPAVVSVYSEKTVKMNGQDGNLPFGNDLFRQFFGQQWSGPQGSMPPQLHEYKVPQHGMGSGMILDKQGHILTNYHVVRDVDKLKVQLADKRQFEAEVVGSDPKSDVAIIHIKGKVPENLPTVKLGSSGALKVGDWVLAVGAPFGLTQTVTAGIISATGRNDVGIADYEDFLQTDAAINPGNSGGPLVNMEGEVIGMNTAIATGYGQFAGVGFAIPSDMIQGFVPTLSKGGAITRGFLGVAIQDLNDTLATQFQVHDTKGALVSQVNNDTPASKAGLKSGDVIVRYDGKPINDTRELRKLVAATTPESKVAMVIMRDGKEKSLDVTVGKLPAKELAAAKGEGIAPSDAGQLGLRVQPLTSELAREFGYDGQRGVLISGVDPGSPAALADLQSGDLIMEANRQPVTTVDELRNALGKSKDMALLLIKRKDASLYVTVRIG
jgi:serine protease Do